MDALEACKTLLAIQVNLAHQDPLQRLFVYTDASNLALEDIINQVPILYFYLPEKKQRHALLSFLSDRFDESLLAWSVLEKEEYVVMNSVDRMHWLVAIPAGFDLYTDRNNLIFVLDPLIVVEVMSQSSIRKVLQWAVKLSV